MVFSSLPLYHLDPQNHWHQQSNDQQQLLIPALDSTGGQLPPPPLPPNNNHGGVCGGGGGGGSTSSTKPNSMVDRARQAQIPLPEPGLKCPRCESTNTKFCYFNNYSLSQPRHFCKTCRRYWTRGGALRNVPVGGGSRRTTKRSKGKSSSNNNSSSGNNNSGSSTRPPMITGSSISGGSSCSTSLFLTPNHLPQLPFLPSSLHHLGNSSPSGIGLNLSGTGGVEMEFPLMGTPNFESLGRMNGMQMHPFDHNNNTTGNFEVLGGRLMPKPLLYDPHHEVFDRVASVKLEDSHQGLNLAKDFGLVHHQATNDHHQHYNWNTNSSMWTNSDLSGFTSPSSNSHLLG